MHGLQASLGESLVAELGSDRAALLIEDLTNEGAPQRLVEFAVQRFGKLDAIVNNAALIATGTIQDTSAERFNEFIRINTLAPYLLIRAALPELRKRRGSVLNIGSVNAHCGEPNLLPYSISKGALMTMTRNLGDTLMRELPKNYAPSGRILEPREIAAAAAYWLSDECGPVSGQVVDLEQYPFIGRNPPKDNTIFSE